MSHEYHKHFNRACDAPFLFLLLIIRELEIVEEISGYVVVVTMHNIVAYNSYE